MIGLIKGTARQVKSVSGLPLPIASYNGNLKAPIKKLSLSINPTQAGSGDPYPAGGGKNKLDGIDPYTVNAGSTSYPLVGTCELQANTTYTLSCKQTGTPSTVARNRFAIGKTNNIWDTNNTVYGQDALIIPSFSFTPTATQTYYVFIWTQNTDANLTYSEFQLEAGSSATSYAPYENICPITGVSSVNVARCGKNIIDKNTKVEGVYPRFIAFGVDNYSDTTPNGSLYLKAGTYTFSVSGENSTNWETFAVYDETNTRLAISYNRKSYSFTVATAGAFRMPIVISSENFVSWDNYDIQLEKNASETAFEAYKGNTYTIDLDGTRYGGTIDIVDGEAVMTVDRAGVDLSTLSWTQTSNRSRTTSLQTLIDKPTSASVITGSICEQFKEVASNSTLTSGEFAVDTSGNLIFFRDADASTPEGLLVYPLANPFTVNLGSLSIPSLLGQNNIWHDANGDVDELVYVNRQLYYGR